MRSFTLTALVGLVAAQSSDAGVSSSAAVVSSAAVSSALVPSTPVATPTPSASPTPTPAPANKNAITVAQDGSGQFTAISAAVNAAQNSGVPTVTILPGTYTEAINIYGSATLTLVGATAAPASDWLQNQVTISSPTLPFSINTNVLKGITLRNINFLNTGTNPVSNAVNIRGDNVAFYACSLIGSTQGTVQATLGKAFFANSYIEGADKLFYNVPNIYLYKSTIVPTQSSGNIVYNKGANAGTPSQFYNSTVVFDSSSIQTKSGSITSNVFIGAPNAAGAVVIVRNSAMGRLIAPAGVHSLAASFSSFYGEYQNTGAGSYDSNKALRSPYDVNLSPETALLFNIDKVFGNAPAPYGNPSLEWIQQDIVASIKASNPTIQPAVSSAAVVSSSVAVSSVTSSSAVISSSAAVASSAPASTNISSSADTSNTSVLSSSGSPSSSFAASSIVSSAAASSVSSSLSGSSTISASITPETSSQAISSSVTNSSILSSSSAAPSCTATASSTFVVSKNPGPCEYGTVTAAINALPKDNKPYTIRVGAGTYVEQLSITRNGKVTLIGETKFTNDYTQNQVRLEFSSGRLTNLGQNEQTPVLYAKKANDNSGFAVYNIDFVNTYPQTYNTAALAADFYGANIAAYGCSFIGFQDTLLANKGTQVFSNCYIEGSVDFVWGFSTAYFYQCMIVSNTPGACIAAHSRASTTAPGGYVFDSCKITYSSTYGDSFGTTYLGRPYSQYSVAVYMNSYLDKHIKDAGWSVWSTSSPQTSDVTFGEYNNAGPGSWQSATQRASFATLLTAEQAEKYKLSAWIGDTAWIDMDAFNAKPSYSLTGPATPITPPTNSTIPSGSVSASSSPTSSVLPISNSTSPVSVHPTSGTTPPAGAVIVAADGKNGAQFTTLSAALASLPKDNTDQTIFMYPGSYNEQIAPINRPGATRIIGYTAGNPGQTYQANQVTITFARGLSVSPLPVGHSNAETAVFATASTKISLYNINMINTENLDGIQPSYVTLAASIYGDKIAFYGCSFDGWQDTLLTGATAGYQYYESCYIGGAIDFIWGYSKAYFKGCTLGAKRKSSAITAHSRSSLSAVGGYIFDQCLFTAAPNAVAGLTGVYLGRPYSQYALVVIKNSYIDSTISPSGWKVWSVTDPRTDAITFAEYNNIGPSNWENNVAARQAFGFAKLLTSDSYPLPSVMASTDWIDMTYWDSIKTPIPSYTPPVVLPPTNVTVNGTSVFNGTAPPAGALIVSKTPINGLVTYATIGEALNAAPASSKTNATIFIYPGVYEEQLIIQKSGHTIFRGYSTATDDYTKNQVTIQFSKGIDTQGTGGSNTDGATVYAKGNFFHAYNINFRNNWGTQQNYASLGFAVQSSKYAGLYGCQIYGNQDTLSISGNLFTFKTYIEGNVDFIYGSGSAYFLDSDIATNEDGISITASKRAANGTVGGFVFDQCRIKPVGGLGPFTNVGLGRPWNSLSRVAYVNCYLDAMISAAGWNPWSKSTPNTNGVEYGEYHNYGPGAGVCGRASFSKQLSDAEVTQYQLGGWFDTASFIDFARLDTQPFLPGMGTAQICASASGSLSSALPSRTAISSMASSSVVSSAASSRTSSSVQSTITSTLTLTASAATITSTTILKITQIVTETKPDIIKTSTEKVTATMTVQSPDVFSTITSVETKDVGLTITPALATSTSLVKSTTTELRVITEAPKTQTLKLTTTILQLTTSTPKPITSTISQGSTRTVLQLVTPKAVDVTSRTTLSLVPSSTKTSTIEAESVTVTSVSIKSTTKKTTTTLSCIPTDQPLKRRGAVIPRALPSPVIVTVTSIYTPAASTIYTSQNVIGTKTSTLKGSTVVQTVTEIAKTSTVELVGQTHLATVTSTSSIGKTTTLKPSTTTVLATSWITKLATSTIEAQEVTISSFQTSTRVQTVLLAQQTIYTTRTIEDVSTSKSTLQASTSTHWVTSTIGDRVATVSVTAAPRTKTQVQKSTVTVFSTATKTAKGARECTA